MCIVYIVSLRHDDGHNLCCLTMLHQPCTRRLAVLGHALAPQVCSGTYSTSWMPCVWQQQQLPSNQQQHQARHDSKPRSTCAAARFVHGCSAAQQTQQTMKIFDRGIHPHSAYLATLQLLLFTHYICMLFLFPARKRQQRNAAGKLANAAEYDYVREYAAEQILDRLNVRA